MSATGGKARDGRGARVAACIVVPNGSRRPEPLADALLSWHPQLTITAAWAGDPQLRPVLATVGSEPRRLDWLDFPTPDERLLLLGPTEVIEWQVAVQAVERLLSDGFERVLIAWSGSIAIAGPIDALVDELVTPSVARFVPRQLVALSTSSAQSALPAPNVCAEIALFGASAGPLLTWLDELLSSAGLGAGSPHGMARILESVACQFPVAWCADDSIGAGPSRWGPSQPNLVCLPNFDDRRPWMLGDGERGDPSITLVDVQRRELLHSLASQLAGHRLPLALPGGLAIDDTVRGAVRASLAAASAGSGARSGAGSVADACPLPWSQPAVFRAWLATTYWSELHGERVDLVAAFPEPVVRDTESFSRWTRRGFIDDGRPMLVRPRATNEAVMGDRNRLAVAEPLSSRGINLVGYLGRETSLGDDARRVLTACRDAALPCAAIAYDRTESPRLADPPPSTTTVEYESTLAIVTAAQFPVLAHDHPELFAATRRMIGYWMWEIEHVPRLLRASIPLVDEIWTGSTFIANAFAAVTDLPVRHLQIPVPEPKPSTRRRAEFAPLRDVRDRPVFLVVFDHFSITERKNPVGAIHAFRRAFRDGEGPVLVVKSMNAERRWVSHQQVVHAAYGRSDIIVWDAHLSRPDQMALVRSADALVSLHRGEGLGLHLAEAMWMGTATVATRYSGNLDFMNDDNSYLVDAELVPIVGGEGIYPATARWAEPDLDQAAAALRAVVDGGPLLITRVAMARQRMLAQPSLGETGQLIGSLLGAAT